MLETAAQRPGPASPEPHSCHAFIRDHYTPLCGFPGCGLTEGEPVHMLFTEREMRVAIATHDGKRLALIPDSWLDAKASGDRRYELNDACTFCKARRNHSPAVHLEELELAGVAS